MHREVFVGVLAFGTATAAALIVTKPLLHEAPFVFTDMRLTAAAIELPVIDGETLPLVHTIVWTNVRDVELKGEKNQTVTADDTGSFVFATKESGAIVTPVHDVVHSRSDCVATVYVGLQPGLARAPLFQLTEARGDCNQLRTDLVCARQGMCGLASPTGGIPVGWSGDTGVPILATPVGSNRADAGRAS
jgi:hypothetical protein